MRETEDAEFVCFQRVGGDTAALFRFPFGRAEFQDLGMPMWRRDVKRRLATLQRQGLPHDVTWRVLAEWPD